jgi:long-chain acyl-CoA synthetase
MEPQIAQVAVFGDRMPHLVAIVVPDAELVKKHKPDSVREQVGAAIERANARLSAIERVRRFTLAREPFAIANEQMTPSLKVRRHKVREVYAEDIAALYR